MSTLKYQLANGFENYQEFTSVKSAVDWMTKTQENFIKNNHKGIFNLVLVDGKGSEINGYDTILKVYSDNNDLWHGSPDGIHINTRGESGGGVVCPDCKAWFCY